MSSKHGHVSTHKRVTAQVRSIRSPQVRAVHRRKVDAQNGPSQYHGTRTCASRESAVQLASDRKSEQSGAVTATFINRSVDSNEKIETQDTLVVMGDCKRGSIVRSKSSIIVMGRLLGDVVAGSAGDQSAVVTAGDLQPRRMKIADVTAKPAYWGKNSSIYGQMAYVSCESEPFPQVNIDNPQVSQFQQGVSERVAGQQSSTYNDELEQVRATVKVVPLARPYISFGPASSQLLRENSDVTLKHSARSAMLTAGYAIALGGLLMVAPVTIFSVLFDPTSVAKGFIRLGGGLLALFGLYYWGAVVGCQQGSGVQGFYSSTIIGRFLVALLCLGIYVCGEAGPGILLFAMMNAVGAVMMRKAMHADVSL